METTYSCGGRRRVTTDEHNQRIYAEEYLCAGGCGTWIPQDTVVWAKADGTLSVMEGEPYCDGCLPPETESEE